MKIVFWGDSITDAWHNALKDITHNKDGAIDSYGCGFVRDIAAELLSKNPVKYKIYNRGIGANTVADLYSRVKQDVWVEQPDMISIHIGINDVSSPGNNKSVDIKRFERIYRMLIEETQERISGIIIILCEPFVLQSGMDQQRFEALSEVHEYAKVTETLAQEYGLYYLPLQKKITENAEQYGEECILYDGVHPSLVGAKIIADEWLNLFENIERNI